jgi:hypothetical protein
VPVAHCDVFSGRQRTRIADTVRLRRCPFIRMRHQGVGDPTGRWPDRPARPVNIDYINEIAEFAGESRVPAISVYRPFAIRGGLISYGPYTPDIFRRSAEYVDRILRGANPADLPVQQPTSFKLVVNLKAALSLGLTMPPALLATADEVIE